ncbi:MAG: VWA domain-containing protein [Acidobacteriota bacterium]
MRRRRPGGGGVQGERWILALLLASQFFGDALPAASPDGGAVIVLLDRSFSMEQTDLWQAAREEADALFTSLPPRSPAALVVFDTQAQVVVPLTRRVQDLKNGLWEGLTTRGRGTLPAAGLESALSLLRSRPAGGIVHLISDFQRTAFNDWKPRLPANVVLVPHFVPAPDVVNQSILPWSLLPHAERPGDGEQFREKSEDRRESVGSLAGLTVRIAGGVLLPAVPILAGTRGRLGVFRLKAAGRRPEIRVVITPLSGGFRGVVAQQIPPDGWPSDDLVFAVVGSRPVEEVPTGLPVRLTGAVAGWPCTVVDPAGIRRELVALKHRAGVFRATGQPGIYRVECRDRVDYLVVNPDAGEGDLSRMPPTLLRRRYSDVNRLR